MKSWFARARGGAALPARLPLAAIARGCSGAALAIGSVGYFASLTHQPLILGSFGASSALLFSLPESPFSQPRNVLAGHCLSSATGLAFLSVCGSTWWSMALAVSVAIGLMHMTRTLHPPAASNPIIVMLSHAGWNFLWMPTLAGAAILVIIALIFNNLRHDVRYPRYW